MQRKLNIRAAQHDALAVGFGRCASFGVRIKGFASALLRSAVELRCP
jgi:hypothetical protein